MMPLITCSGCSKEISERAENCPDCGGPMETQMKCPISKSTDIEKISKGIKPDAALMWGG